jgi:hypothetical protein
MAIQTPAEQQQVVDELAREIAVVARELAEVGLTADLDLGRLDWDCICTASERMLELQRSCAGLYRRLLVVRVRPSQIAERSSV